MYEEDNYWITAARNSKFGIDMVHIHTYNF
jgi:hypothetical protein